MFKRVRVVIPFLTICCVAFLAVDALAQTASIVGTVKDPSGAVLPGVSITIKNTGTGLTRELITNETGDYTVPLLPIGTYEIGAGLPGFKTATKSGITLKIDDRIRVDFKLEVGDITEKIVVTETAPLVQSENASIGNVIDNVKIVELPLDGREFYQLARLNPGVYEPAQNSTIGFRGGFNVAGASEVTNSYSLDGVENMDMASNQPAHRPSVDTIQEFKVLTGTYSAEYGRHSGGQIIVTTKSGTNELHGTGFEFYRNSKMDAKNFFNTGNKQPFNRNQFGGTLGGPINKNRTFFFAGFEGNRAHEQQTVLSTVPSEKMRTGDLSELLDPTNPFTSAVTVIRDPVTGQNFPGNIIPSARINRVAKDLMEIWYPRPNRGLDALNYEANGTRKEYRNQWNAKIDHKFSDKNNLSAGYQYMNNDPYEGLGYISLCGTRTLPGHGCTDTTKTQAAFISDVHLFSPNMIHELRLGFTRLYALRIPEAGNSDIATRLAQPGLPGAEFKYNQGGPQVSIAGFASIGPSSGNPQGRWDNTYNIIDHWNFNHGSHSVKVGTDLRYFQFNSFHAANRGGVFTFVTGSSSLTNYSFGDFLLGLPRTANRNTGIPYTVTTDVSYNFFAQDDWKLTDKLTVNFGVRYEYNRPIRERADQIASFDPKTNSVRVAHCGNAVVDANNNLVYTPGKCDSREVWTFDKNNFAPRIGIAYRPGANSTFVVRAGYGVYYDDIVSGNGLSGLWRGLPFRITSTITTIPTNPISLSDPFTPAPGRPLARFTQPSIDEHMVTPYIQQWSFGLQKELASSLALETTYYGSTGNKLVDSIPINNPDPGPSATTDARRPYQPWGGISNIANVGRSYYNSLQVRLDKRMANGVSGLISYTWGKSVDTGVGTATGGDGDSGTQNPKDYYGSRGLSTFDVRHRFVGSYTIEVPLGQGHRFLNNASNVVDAILGGWQLSGIVTLQTGSPFSPTTADVTGGAVGTQRANLLRDWHVDNPNPDRWYDRTAFCGTTACGLTSFGNAGRNSLTGPSVKKSDLSLQKFFQIREGQRLQFRAEMFNFTNHPNFFLPNGRVDQAAGGKISQASPGRVVQLGLKYLF